MPWGGGVEREGAAALNKSALIFKKGGGAKFNLSSC